MAELGQNGAPVAPNLILDRRGHYRNDQYVSPAGADTWNEYSMAKYNNDYNYWLLQQQQQYNSPVEQVKRLRAAGLNPNFNSIEGAGNTNYSMAASTRGLSSNVGSLGNQQLGLMLNAFNSTLGAISQGVDMTSKISHIPSDIKKYRKALTNSEEYKALSAKRKSEIDTMLSAFEAWTMGQRSEMPFAGWSSDLVAGKLESGTDLYSPYQTGVSNIGDTPKGQLYAANLDYKQKSAAYIEAQKVLADLRYNSDKWQSDPQVLADRKAVLAKQLEILGVDKSIRDWVLSTKEVNLALNIVSSMLNVASQAYGLGSVL